MARKTSSFLACIFALACAIGCSRERSVDLALDYSASPRCRYAVDAIVNGTIHSPDGNKEFTSAAQCTLRCDVDAKDKALLHASVPYARFTSTILADAELENLMAQSREVRLTCNFRDAAIVPDDTTAMPFIRIGEWDIFKDMVKTIPALPKIRVKAGATWDRERAIPLDTRHGAATGHLLQSFRLDSIYTAGGNRTFASIGWNFTYQPEFRDRDAAGLLEGPPSKGKGAGTAIINVSARTLESASMSFSVPETSEGTFRISWSEKISINLVR